MVTRQKINDRSKRVRRQINAKSIGLREHLGPFAYSLVFLTVVVTWAAIGAAISTVVSARHPTFGIAPVVFAPSTPTAKSLPGHL